MMLQVMRREDFWDEATQRGSTRLKIRLISLTFRARLPMREYIVRRISYTRTIIISKSAITSLTGAIFPEDSRLLTITLARLKT